MTEPGDHLRCGLGEMSAPTRAEFFEVANKLQGEHLKRHLTTTIMQDMSKEQSIAFSSHGNVHKVKDLEKEAEGNPSKLEDLAKLKLNSYMFHSAHYDCEMLRVPTYTLDVTKKSSQRECQKRTIDAEEAVKAKKTRLPKKSAGEAVEDGSGGPSGEPAEGGQPAGAPTGRGGSGKGRGRGRGRGGPPPNLPKELTPAQKNRAKAGADKFTKAEFEFEGIMVEALADRESIPKRLLDNALELQKIPRASRPPWTT
ncbi:unnamed protein product [Prorocentrum cordatum]|uniref:Uncharacterized protein n=1 Tax=Prorocentrum cordatum TaxID=2364126 RepID=A0ABN9SI09_9DINO|nr:unnamed protein product [Polarella glacialis]